jgi:ABC-type nitrate/sulfonate/bicarbonate transport system permease component
MESASVFAALFVLCLVGVALFGAVALAELLVRRSYGRR